MGWKFYYFNLLVLAFSLCVFMNCFSSQNKDSSQNQGIISVVFSSQGSLYREKRNVVRETWMKDLHFWCENVKTKCLSYFVIGEKHGDNEINTEQEAYNDIMFVPYDNSYATLVNRTCYIMLWSLTKQFDYFFKTDDDSYVNVPAFMQKLATSPREKLYWGRFWGVKVSHYTWTEFTWSYASGMGYVISYDVLHAIHQSLKTFTPHIPKNCIMPEDLFVGHMLAPYDLKRVNDKHFHELRHIHPVINGEVTDKSILIHHCSPSDMRKLHTTFSRRKKVHQLGTGKRLS